LTLLPSSLLGRTALIIGGTLLLSQLAAFKLFQLYYQGPLVQQIAGLAVSQIRTVGFAIAKLKDDARDEFLDELEEKEGIRVLFDNDSVLPSKLPEDRLLRNFADEVRKQLGGAIEFFVQPKSGRALWVKLPVGIDKAWIGIPRSQIELGFPWAWLALALGAALIALIAATLLVRRVNQPLRQLADAASVLGKGNYPEPINESGPSEVKQVAHSFNQMLADVKALDQERAILLAGISHDLRTPLARMRLATEMLSVDADLKQNMAQDIDEMDAIVKQFLDFARLAEQEIPVSTNLNELVKDIVSHYRHRGIDIDIDPGEVEPLALRATNLRRALTNLIENAIKYGQPPIEIKTGKDRERIFISIRDHGPGIPESDRERLLRPFTRLTEARSGPSGAGLGLAIVDRIAKLHGGRLELLTPEGGGLEARLNIAAQ
jgi:two-component system, OmpR family, osmolarity sensor histidine kinase EnvZ